MGDSKFVVTAITVEKRKLTLPMMVHIEFVHGMDIKPAELLFEIEFKAKKGEKKVEQRIFRAYMMDTVLAGTGKVRCKTDRVKLHNYPKELVPANGRLKLTLEYKKQRFLKYYIPISIKYEYIQKELPLMPPMHPRFEQAIVESTGVETKKYYDIRWDD